MNLKKKENGLRKILILSYRTVIDAPTKLIVQSKELNNLFLVNII